MEFSWVIVVIFLSLAGIGMRLRKGNKIQKQILDKDKVEFRFNV